jgi:amino acid adenylation domain-containing protein
VALAPFSTLDLDHAEPVPERIMRWARDQPGQPAIVSDTETVSYAELVRRASRIAGALRAAGVGRDATVPLWLERSPDLIACALGVLLAGGAYVGMDVHEPPARAAAILADCGAPVILTDHEHAATLPARAGGEAILLIEDLRLEDLRLDRTESDQLSEKVDSAPEALCYVTFTSGSTGTPKGVMVEHGGVAVLVDWYVREFGVGPGDRMPQLARPSFDGWALEVWPCLAGGATLCLGARRLPDSAQDVVDWLTGQGVSVGFFTTALAVQLLAARWPEPGAGPMRAMLLGGEKLHAPPAVRPPFRLYHAYGPTETTMLATCGEITEATPSDASPPIGRTLPGLHGLVLDGQGEPVPDGEPGELHLWGLGVARGYLGHPELTAARFRTAPGADPAARGSRIYATGDVVRRLPDGGFLFVGRTDDQVKLRGFRIEPGEVEAAMLAVDGVARACVVVHEPPGETGPEARRLVGYWVARDAATAPEGDLVKKLLADALPGYMVPHLLVRLDDLPLTPHGKTDRAVLRARPLTTSRAEAADPAESAESESLTPMERRLADLWCSVLGISVVARDDSFFDLGGDSLLAMRLAAEARRQGLRLGAEDLFENDVLCELAAALAQPAGTTQEV